MVKNFDLNNLDDSVRELLAEVDQEMAPDAIDVELQRLEKRHGQKSMSWLERNQRHVLPATVFSYVCNLASAGGFVYSIKMLFEGLPYKAIGWFIASIALILFERYKRSASDNMWDDFWRRGKRISWRKAGINFSFFLLSLLGTVYGVYFMIDRNPPEAKEMGISDDPEAVAIMDQVETKEAEKAKLDAENKAARANKSNYNRSGEFYWPLQQAEQARINQSATLSADIATLNATLQSKYGIVKVKNKEIISKWEIANDYRMKLGVGLTLLLEIVFEFLMAFLSLVDYKKWLFLKKLKARSLATSP